VRELPVSGSLRPITGRNPLVARDDALLEILGLPPNGETQEDESLNDDEEAFLIEEIVAKMSDPVATMGAFDDASRVRIFRGMITNNKGPVAERVAEAVAMYERVAAFLAAGGGDLSVPVDGERALADAMNTVVGGCDRYGHLLWAERLGDVERAVERGVTPESARRCRLKTMEAIRCAQIRAVERRGPRRYKQIYVIDLAGISIASLLGRAAVRDVTKEIVQGANAYYPETLWRLFVVNAPFVFRSVYAMLSPFIHPVTKQKIKILGGPSKFLPEMARDGIPADAVPAMVGGDAPGTPLAVLLPELVADGFPRAARKTRLVSLSMDPADDRDAFEENGEDAARERGRLLGLEPLEVAGALGLAASAAAAAAYLFA